MPNDAQPRPLSSSPGVRLRSLSAWASSPEEKQLLAQGAARLLAAADEAQVLATLTRLLVPALAVGCQVHGAAPNGRVRLLALAHEREEVEAAWREQQARGGARTLAAGEHEERDELTLLLLTERRALAAVRLLGPRLRTAEGQTRWALLEALLDAAAMALADARSRAGTLPEGTARTRPAVVLAPVMECAK